MGDLSHFERGQIIGACLAGASVTESTTLLGVLRATVSEVMSACTRIVSKNYRTTAPQVTAELNILLEDPVSTKTVRCELHKSNIYSRAAIAKPLIT
jgi:hypothetical protein